MPDKETPGRRSIDQVERPRARPAKLERISRDTARRSGGDEELDKAWSEWETTFDAIQDSIMLLDCEFNIVQANAATSLFFDKPLDEIVGKSYCKLVYGADEPPEGCPLTKIKSTKKRQEAELSMAEKEIWAVVSVDPILDEQHNMTGAVHTIRDITERKKAERDLLSKQDELKSLTSELSLAEERERRRIAAGIHDDIGQKLALAKLELQMFMSSPGDSKMPASLESVCATIDNAINDCHSLTFELSNPALYELSFEAAIEQWLYEQIQKKHGIECEVAVNGDPVQPAEDIKVTLFRAIREVAVNVVKHAKATALRVSIERVGDNVRVSLADNGAGFAPEAAGAALSMDKTGGFGLFNIKERLEHLGGNVKIESSPRRGTTITLTAPLEQQDNKQAKEAEQ